MVYNTGSSTAVHVRSSPKMHNAGSNPMVHKAGSSPIAHKEQPRIQNAGSICPVHNAGSSPMARRSSSQPVELLSFSCLVTLAAHLLMHTSGGSAWEQ